MENLDLIYSVILVVVDDDNVDTNGLRIPEYNTKWEKIIET